jgi:hypothetical protein
MQLPSSRSTLKKRREALTSTAQALHARSRGLAFQL